jgi:hypothetical protein
MPDSDDRRSQPRITWRGELHLVLPGNEPIPATIRDISTSGFGLWTDRLVPPGATVEVQGDGFCGNGKVQYCQAQGARYRVGVSLDADSEG